MLRSLLRTSIGIALLTVTAAPAAAQGVIGFETGVNVARLSFKDEPALTFGTRTGPVGGAFFIVQNDARVTAQIDVLFAERGGTITAPAPETTFRIRDLEIPAMARFNVSGNHQHRVYVLAGPSLAIRLDAKRDTSSGIQDMNDTIERMGVDVVVGAGIDFSALTFNARYSQSLRNLDKTGSETVHHQDVTFIVGFGF